MAAAAASNAMPNNTLIGLVFVEVMKSLLLDDVQVTTPVDDCEERRYRSCAGQPMERG
jgi:hypothetical protein